MLAPAVECNCGWHNGYECTWWRKQSPSHYGIMDYVNKFEVFHHHLYLSSLKTSFDISYYRDFDQVILNY